MRRLGFAVAMLALAALAWWAIGTGSPNRPHARADRAASAARVEPGPQAASPKNASQAPAAAAAAPEASGSLRETEVDGALVTGPDGRLVISPDVRRFFEYFFVASGESSSRLIAVRVVEAINGRLQGDAAREAHALFERFLRYRARVEAFAAAAPEDLEQRYAALRRLRAEVFGEADAAALFGDEDAVYAAALAERRIRADPSLSESEREAQFAGVEAALPEEVREARRAAMAPLALARDEAALRAAGGSEEEVQALRKQAVGAAAAERLAALDQQRAAWQARVDAYRRERATLDADPALDPAQRAAAIAALRARHFQGPELMRIEALDRLAAPGE